MCGGRESKLQAPTGLLDLTYDYTCRYNPTHLPLREGDGRHIGYGGVMTWKPAKTLGFIVGLIFILTLLGIDFFLVRTLFIQEIGLNFYVTALLLVLSVPLLVLWCHWFYGFISLRYYLDRNGLIILGGGYRHVVPMDSIRSIVRGDQVTLAQGFRGVGWPGYLMGRMWLKELGPLITHSTEPLERQLIIITDSVCYGISPKEEERFLEDFPLRQALGPIHKLAEETERSPLMALHVWRDRWFWGLVGLGFVACTALFGLVFSRYGGLPDRIPIRLTVLGEADWISTKDRLFLIPAIGALAFLANGLFGLIVHRFERLAAYLLGICTLLIQSVLWLAILRILLR